MSKQINNKNIVKINNVQELSSFKKMNNIDKSNTVFKINKNIIEQQIIETSFDQNMLENELKSLSLKIKNLLNLFEKKYNQLQIVKENDLEYTIEELDNLNPEDINIILNRSDIYSDINNKTLDQKFNSLKEFDNDNQSE